MAQADYRLISASVGRKANQLALVCGVGQEVSQFGAIFLARRDPLDRSAFSSCSALFPVPDAGLSAADRRRDIAARKARRFPAFPQ